MAKPDFCGDLSPGLRVGGARFLLKRLIGRGEFSEVWLARDVKKVKDVALKFLPRAFLQDENLLEHIRQEVRRTIPLKQAQVVSTYELVVDHDVAAIVMEFVDGWSLATMKVDKLCHCYTLEDIEPWIRELGDALTHAHNDVGIVHGDLKPSNLLASTREGIKVSDFGFAALIRSESSKRGLMKSGYSGIGFLSPQQVMGAQPTKLDDIYSLGATIFDLLTGTPPFYKGEIIAQVCGLKPPAMTQRLKELAVQCDPISPVWEDTVAACLAKNPTDRPQSVEEVLRLLERKELPPTATSRAEEKPAAVEPSEADETEAPVTDDELVQVIPPIVPPSTGSPATSRPVVAMFTGVIALLLVAGLAAAAFWLVHQTHSTTPSVSTSPPVTSSVSLDKSFNPGIGADGTIRCLALQPDGKILIGGVFTNFNGVASRKLARLNPDGSLDTSFTSQVTGNVYAIALQSDGKILVGGQGLRAKRPGRKFIRLNPDGSRDQQFHGEGAYNENVRTIVIQPDGAILVGGDFSTVSAQTHNGLLRLATDEKPDDQFSFGSDGESTITSIAVQADGKIFAAGVFKNINDVTETHLIRLNADGSFDPGFNDAPFADVAIRKVLLQPDGKILACGYSAATNNPASSYIARLNSDGSPDANFHSAASVGDALWTMAVQMDGKIVIGGQSKGNGPTHPFLARLNADGSPDNSFQVTGAAGSAIWSMAVQPDGKIIAVGAINSMDSLPCGNIIRLQN